MTSDFLGALGVAVHVLAALFGFRVVYGSFSAAGRTQTLSETILIAAGSLLLLLFALGWASLPSIWIVSAVVHGLAIAGLVGLYHPLGLVRYGSENRIKVAAATLVFVVFLLFWARVMRDLLALPSRDDGVSHSAFLMALLHHGNALIHRDYLEFGREFGWNRLDYYPTGPHAIVAAFEWPWVLSGLISQAAALKAWTLAFLAGLAPTCYWLGRRMFPNERAWVHVLCGTMAVAFPYFPMVPLDQGAFGRCMAIAVGIPFVIFQLTQPSPKPRDTLWRAGMLLGLPLSFFLHTSAMFLVMVSFGLIGVARLVELPAKERKGEILWNLVLLLVGMAVFFLFLHDTAGLAQIDPGGGAGARGGISWAAFLERCGAYLRETWAGKGGVSISQVSVQEGLVAIGAVAVVVRGGRLPLGFPRYRLVLYSVGYTLACFIILSTAESPNIHLHRLGAIFLHYTNRASEASFLVVIPLACVGLTLAIRGVVLGARKCGRGSWAIVGLACLGFALDRYHVAEVVRRHLDYYFDVYHSPRRSRHGPIFDFIIDRTPKDAVIVAGESGIFDMTLPVTGRRGFFMFNECPHHKRLENCMTRRVGRWRLVENLSKSIEKAETYKPCVPPLFHDLGSTFFFLEPGEVPGLGSLDEDASPCGDLAYRGTVAGYRSYEYIRPDNP